MIKIKVQMNSALNLLNITYVSDSHKCIAFCLIENIVHKPAL